MNLLEWLCLPAAQGRIDEFELYTVLSELWLISQHRSGIELYNDGKEKEKSFFELTLDLGNAFVSGILTNLRHGALKSSPNPISSVSQAELSSCTVQSPRLFV